MTDLRQAAQQALEALTYIYTETTADEDELIDEAITALRTALEQPEQQAEPVAWMFQHDETGRMNYVSNDGIHNPTTFIEMNPRYALVCPLYTTPPQRQWVGLEAEDLAQIDTDEFWQVGNHMAIAMAVEAKLREKNT